MATTVRETIADFGHFDPEPRAPERVPDVARPAKSRGGARAEERARRRGLVLKPLRLAEVGRRMERLGQLAARRERGAVGEKAPDRRKLEPRERASVHGRETPGEPRT